jgi:tetratricopeptide (TPR) repeat protein
MVLNWSGEPAKPEDLTPITYTAARQGSLQADILSAARRHGRLAYPVSTLEHLLAEVAAGHPVLVLQNLGLSWIPRWHYAVVVGYELGRGQVILRSGLERREVLPLGLFTRTWARGGNWGIVVLAPGTLPARPAETPYLQAAIGLEQARQWRAAVRAYSAALVPWPGSLGALIGLGNSHYALGELSQAQAALREATRLHPQSGAAWNNLAVVLAKQRRYREARAAAQHAVTLGGALSEEYRKTLIEIEKAGSQG